MRARCVYKMPWSVYSIVLYSWNLYVVNNTQLSGSSMDIPPRREVHTLIPPHAYLDSMFAWTATSKHAYNLGEGRRGTRSARALQITSRPVYQYMPYVSWGEVVLELYVYMYVCCTVQCNGHQ
jgi:hypothetical protein